LGGRKGHIKVVFRGFLGGKWVRGAILHIEMAEKWAEMDKNGVETVKMGKIGKVFFKKN
jgi:hypothetical protein